MGIVEFGFILGILATLWPTTLGALGYVLWRYVYVPWKIMRADLKALHDAFQEFRTWTQNELGFRKAMVPTEIEAARAEARLKARRQWSEQNTTTQGS